MQLGLELELVYYMHSCPNTEAKYVIGRIKSRVGISLIFPLAINYHHVPNLLVFTAAHKTESRSINAGGIGWGTVTCFQPPLIVAHTCTIPS